MLYLLHGDDQAASRKRLSELKFQFSAAESRSLDGKSLDLTTLTQALSSNSLFLTDTVIIIERLFSKLGRQPKLVAKYAQTLKDARDSNVLLWEEKELTPTTIKLLGEQVQNEIFKLPVVLWQFLDNLAPGKPKLLLELYEKVLTTNAAELISALLVKRIRHLIMLHSGATPNDLQNWQAGRLTTQARSFTIEQLIRAHAKLLELEYRLKSGSTPFSMSELVEQWLISL